MQRVLSSRVTGFEPVIALSWPGTPPFPAKEAADEAEILVFFAKINITNFQALFCWFCQTYGTALFSYTESMTSGDAETAPPLFCVLS